MAKRGGSRKGAGRPKERVGNGMRVDFFLDEPSEKGARLFAKYLETTVPTAIRKLLTSWYQSTEIKKAVDEFLKTKD